jgi:hypothetical protein
VEVPGRAMAGRLEERPLMIGSESSVETSNIRAMTASWVLSSAKGG